MPDALANDDLIVLDSNVLRKEAVVGRALELFGRTGRRLGLPHIALFEMTKHPSWQSTVAASLRLVSECPQAIAVTAAAKTLGLQEERTGCRTSSIVDASGTARMHDILRDLPKGDGAWTQFIDAIKAHRDALEHEAHLQDSRAVMRHLVATVAALLEKSVRAQVSHDLAAGQRESFRALCTESLVLHGFEGAALRRGVDPSVARSLVAAPPVSVVNALGMSLIAFEWAILGGIESARPERFSNDILDVEYIIAGLWSGALTTEDGRARTRLEDVREVCSRLWPKQSGWFARSRCGPTVESVAQ